MQNLPVEMLPSSVITRYEYTPDLSCQQLNGYCHTLQVTGNFMISLPTGSIKVQAPLA